MNLFCCFVAELEPYRTRLGQARLVCLKPGTAVSKPL